MTQNAPPPWGPPPGQPAAAPQHGSTGAPPPWAQPGQPPPAAPGAPQNPPWGTQVPPTNAPAPQWGPPQGAPPAGPPPMGPPAGYGPPQGYPPPGSPVGGAPAGYPPPPGYGAPPQGYGPPQGYPAPGGYGGPSYLDGIGDAQAYTKTPFFPAGVDCIVQIEELKGVISQDPAKLGALIIVVECSIVSSQTQGVQPGNRFAQVINLAKYGKGDLKMVLTAAHGCVPGNPAHEQWLAQQGVYSKEKVSEFIGQTQPLRGRKMGLRTVFKPNKNPMLAQQGKGFTNHYWSPAQ